VIYDIAKKLGLENKEILAKAKALGIAAAKVPSSSLDKISAEWLEEEIIKDHPDLAARLRPPAEEKPKPAPSRKKLSSSAPRRRLKPRRWKPGLNHRKSKLNRTNSSRRRGTAGGCAAARRPNPPARNRSAIKSDSSNCPRPSAGRGPGRTAVTQPGAVKLPPHATGDPFPSTDSRQPFQRSFATAAAPHRLPVNRQARRAAQPNLSRRTDRRSHHHQAADCRARTGRRAEAKAVQDHRRFDEAWRFRHGQPGD
jgi:hypothetical protein